MYLRLRGIAPRRYSSSVPRGRRHKAMRRQLQRAVSVGVNSRCQKAIRSVSLNRFVRWRSPLMSFPITLDGRPEAYGVAVLVVALQQSCSTADRSISCVGLTPQKCSVTTSRKPKERPSTGSSGVITASSPRASPSLGYVQVQPKPSGFPRRMRPDL